MSLSNCFRSCYALVALCVNAATRCIARVVSCAVAAVRWAIGAGCRVGQAVRRHPVKSGTSVLATGATWLYFGSVPLLAALVVVALPCLSAGLVRW